MKQLPLIMLSDGVGVVHKVGEGVADLQEGDRVCPLMLQSWLAGDPDEQRLSLTLGVELDGTMAEFIVLPENGVVSRPRA